ncbi:hypothetical protein ABW17_01600 [Mycobacterium nebraskense]|uniref:hypothetical protein n=1 Tax=Mycobacterium nebraskense TaxID=244292 RepID=UPI000641AF14|nr:hypothetical protein [Mycobacterium nebraskense]KLO46581.1 hypothetical protein ABW17_01600 [Mycobacterium nebraskense]
MPGGDAEFGDVYWVTKEATENPARVGKPVRPMACMAERREDTTWAGLPRITSDEKPEDRPSKAMPEIHATRLGTGGWWTARYIHPVYKAVTGHAGKCEYLGQLPKDEVKVAREVYRGRLYDS